MRQHLPTTKFGGLWSTRPNFESGTRARPREQTLAWDHIDIILRITSGGLETCSAHHQPPGKAGPSQQRGATRRPDTGLAEGGSTWYGICTVYGVAQV